MTNKLRVSSFNSNQESSQSIKFVQTNTHGFIGTIENIVVEEFAGGGEELGFSEINMSNIERVMSV